MTQEKAHAKLSASGSERWLNCPGSVALSAKAPPQLSSRYAQEGTKAHEILETFLKTNVLNTKTSSTDVFDEMFEHAKAAAEYIRSQKTPEDELLCETKVSLEFIAPDMFGTVDAAIVAVFDTLHVIDYKYGAGIAVAPENNSQMLYYALGLAHKYNYNFRDVKLTIIQPRAEHPKGPIRSHTISIENLMLWKELFRDGANRALNKDAPLNSGEWCRWCPAKTICPKLSTEAFEEALIDFEPQTSALVTVNEPESLSVLTISNALLAAEKIETWIGALREHALYLAQSGAKIPKFKIVKKRSTRKWLDSENLGDKLVNSFGPECYEKKLVSPAQFEKRFKNDAGAAEVLRNFTVNESSGVTLVSESDPRPEYFEADHDFEDVITIERKECDVAKKTTKNTKTTKTTVIKKR